jgi:hypothetical protein
MFDVIKFTCSPFLHVHVQNEAFREPSLCAVRVARRPQVRSGTRGRQPAHLRAPRARCSPSTSQNEVAVECTLGLVRTMRLPLSLLRIARCPSIVRATRARFRPQTADLHCALCHQNCSPALQSHVLDALAARAARARLAHPGSCHLRQPASPPCDAT